MPFNSQDLTHVENLLRALKKAKYELEGLEVLAMAETMRWVSSKLVPEIKVQIQKDMAKSELAGAIAKAPKKSKKQGGD